MIRSDLPAPGGAGARAMLFRAFVAQNAAVGLAYGGFGICILPLQDRFGVGRGAVSLGLSLVVLMTGLIAPLVPLLAQRFGLRTIMVAGALMCCSGYALLSVAHDIGLALAAYALLLGPGVGLSGTLPAIMLVSGWFSHARGRATGTATMPVVLALTPVIGLAAIVHLGLDGLFLVLAGLHLATVPVLLGIREAPPSSGTQENLRSGRHARPMTARAVLSRPLFWMVMLGAGLLNAVGIIGSIHMVAVMIERGLSPAQAALLASLMGGASVAGALGFGWLGDRLGGAWSLALVAVCIAVSWAIIASTSWLPLMFPAILLVGAAGPGVFTSVSLLFGHVFGAATMPRAAGLFSMFSVPFTFLLPPVAGWLHDVVGHYGPVMAAIVCGSVLVAGLFCAIGRAEPARDRQVA
jgi:cyanate permease